MMRYHPDDSSSRGRAWASNALQI